MMPNANNLALTLVSDKGKTQTKGNKSTSEKNSEFLKLFGKEKKDEKKKIQNDGVGAAMLPFKFTDNSLNVKPTEKTSKTIDAVGNLKNTGKIETFGMKENAKVENPIKEVKDIKDIKTSINVPKDIKIENSLQVKNSGDNKVENKANVGVIEVLGKRIESTKSNDLKQDKILGIKTTAEIKTAEVKAPTNVQSLKKENLKVEDLGAAKLQNSLEVKESPIQDVQNKGRITPSFYKRKSFKYSRSTSQNLRKFCPIRN